jgi:hypothetical protein
MTMVANQGIVIGFWLLNLMKSTSMLITHSHLYGHNRLRRVKSWMWVPF